MACETTTPVPIPSGAPSSTDGIGEPSAAPSQTTSAGVSEPIPPLNPLDVTIAVDPENVVSTVVGPDGGSLELTLAGGSRAKLAIPPGALAGSVEISMSEIATIEGWTFMPAGFAAVQLLPDGLRLLAPATLSIEREEDMSKRPLGQVSWAGGGEDLHPVPASASPHGASLPIDHFSGYGLTWDMNLSYWGDWEVYRARTLEAYLEQQFARLLGLERQNQLLLNSEPTDLVDEVMSVVGQWYDWVYSALMGVAGTSCENARTAAIAQETFVRKLALLGVDIADVWNRFSAGRREKGLPVPYPFDKLSPGFMTTLVETCDRQALDECLATGDIVLLAGYVAQRNKLIEFALGEAPSGISDGSNLLVTCGRYRVDLDVTFSFDKMVSGGLEGYYQLFEMYERWRYTLSVDLQWEPLGEGRLPYEGRIVGKAIPTSTPESLRIRFHDLTGTHSGTIDEGWTPWCAVTEKHGAWMPWPVELKGLDFHREPAQIPPPPLPIWVTGVMPQGPGPTFDYDGPLRTTSFIFAKVNFDAMAGPEWNGTYYTCKGHKAAGGSAPSGGAGIGAFLIAHPAGSRWTMGTDGLAENLLTITKASSYPEIAKQVWTACDPAPVEKDVEYKLTCSGTLTLTHTAGP